MQSLKLYSPLLLTPTSQNSVNMSSITVNKAKRYSPGEGVVIVHVPSEKSGFLLSQKKRGDRDQGTAANSVTRVYDINGPFWFLKQFLHLFCEGNKKCQFVFWKKRGKESSLGGIGLMKTCILILYQEIEIQQLVCHQLNFPSYLFITFSTFQE